MIWILVGVVILVIVGMLLASEVDYHFHRAPVGAMAITRVLICRSAHVQLSR
jgi:hypothetical protein